MVDKLPKIISSVVILSLFGGKKRPQVELYTLIKENK